MEPNAGVLLAGPSDWELMSALPALRERGWRPLVASDAVMVVTTVRSERPSVIVLSEKLPRGGALTALRRLRSNVHTTSIPVLVVTESAAFEERLRKTGEHNCIPAPVEPEVLCAALEQVIGVSVAVTEAPEPVLRNPERLAAVERAGLLDHSKDETLDSLTELCAQVLGVPTALVSIVDEDRQFFKSHRGLGEPWATARETPLSHSFCQWVVSGSEPLSVTDAREHPTLRLNLAIKDLGVIAYAGWPVSSVSGQPLGSFCAIDSAPRDWSEAEIATVRDLSAVVDAHVATAELVAREGGESERALKMHALAESVRAATRILRRVDPSISGPHRERLLALVDRHAELLAHDIAEAWLQSGASDQAVRAA